MQKVAVLLSVFNGQKYIKEQIDSILTQIGVDVSLFVRDDGSTDSTAAILTEYANAYGNVRFVSEANVGISNSFLSMLTSCPFDADFYAFCDADDVWLPEKLKRAVDMLRDMGTDRPALYCSQIRLVDADLNDIGFGAPLFRPLSFENAMIECRVAGATAVINSAAREVLKRYNGSDAVMHDAWLYLVVSAFGQCVFDHESFILYRQHGGNHTGAGVSTALTWRRRFARADLSVRHRRQAESLLRQARDELPAPRRMALERFVGHTNSLLSRWAFALRPTVLHQRPRSDLLFRLMVAAGQS